MNITRQPAWLHLQQHYEAEQALTLRERFALDPDRFAHMHERLHGMLFDYSKNRVSETTLDLLGRLADTADVRGWADKMRRGDKINSSEGRAVLHTALRLPENAAPVYVDGTNVVPLIHHELIV